MKLPNKSRKPATFVFVLFFLGSTICIVGGLIAVISLNNYVSPQGVEISSRSALEKNSKTEKPNHHLPRVSNLEKKVVQQLGQNEETTMQTLQEDLNFPDEEFKSNPNNVTKGQAPVRLETVTNPTPTEETKFAQVKSNEIDNMANIPPFANGAALDVQPWQVNAVTVKKLIGIPQVAVVIDDAGLDRNLTSQAMRLAGPLTFSFLPYAAGLKLQVQNARKLGHEIMAHIPMEPNNPLVDPGPQFLATGQTIKEIKKRLEWSLSRVPGIVGINNHMGSRFTSDIRGMKIVIEEIHLRGLLFLDSKTSHHTIGAKLAKKYKVPFAIRNVFLDHEPGLSFIQGQLIKLEAHAKLNGFAVAICHPRNTTIEALYQWLPIVAEKGLVLVPVSAIAAMSNRAIESPANLLLHQDLPSDNNNG